MAPETTIPFFTPADLQQLTIFGNTTYDKSNTQHEQVGDELRKNVWAKTEYWYNRVLAELEGFEGECEKRWLQRGHDGGEIVSVFKSYTWAKIYREGDKSRDIYFTVGAQGEDEALVYKMDFQFIGNSRLSYAQKEQCQQLIKTRIDWWNEVPVDEVEDNDWNTLVARTVIFIQRYMDVYDQVMEQVWGSGKRITRLVFNTKGWIEPSGRFGKSTAEGTHEAIHGYGHEEWLFDYGKIIDGYHYGFFEAVRRQFQAFTGKRYTVWLYTFNALTKRRLWIGEVDQVEVLTKEEAERIYQEYDRRGWLDQMEQQIIDCGANPDGFSEWKGLDLFNVKFKSSNVRLNDPYIEIGPEHPVANFRMYSFANFEDRHIIPLDENVGINLPDAPNVDQEDNDNDDVQTSTYYREPRPVEIIYLHKAISKKLTTRLKQEYGAENVFRELNAGYGAHCIDIGVRVPDGLHFYEIKTYTSLKSSIREAFGQLMEYCCWTTSLKARKLIVVTQPHSREEMAKAISYCAHIRATFNIPIYYQSFNMETGDFSET